MDSLKKAEILVVWFGVYGHGNFNITIEEVSQIFQILESKDAEDKLKKFYERLYGLRMGSSL